MDRRVTKAKVQSLRNANNIKSDDDFIQFMLKELKKHRGENIDTLRILSDFEDAIFNEQGKK